MRPCFLRPKGFFWNPTSYEKTPLMPKRQTTCHLVGPDFEADLLCADPTGFGATSRTHSFGDTVGPHEGRSWWSI